MERTSHGMKREKKCPEIERILNEIEPGTKVVFISGFLNIIHSGHLRLFNFARECGDIVVVGIKPDGADGAVMDQKARLEGAKALSIIDYAFIMDEPVDQVIRKLQPHVVVKGKEHENRENIELEALNDYGGKLLFGSSDTRFSTIELLRAENENSHLETIVKPREYLKRHRISEKRLLSLVEKFKDLKVVVIGDLIIDEYVTCEALGMSQEDPTLVVSPLTKKTFLGGAGIVAAHATGLGAKANYFTIVGEDEASVFGAKKLAEYGVAYTMIADRTRPTTVKRRFRVMDKTLLRVNELRQHEMNSDLQADIFAKIESLVDDAALLIFSDFNYGCLPQTLVERISRLCETHGVTMVADSQSSSQVGDVSRYANMSLITPTEREARLATRDFTAGLVELVSKLQEKAKPENVIITLGSEGILVQTTPKDEHELRTDRLAAMNVAPKDVAGGGDSLLISSALALAAGATIWEAAYIGSIAAAFQVGRVGNVPLKAEELIEGIRH